MGSVLAGDYWRSQMYARLKRLIKYLLFNLFAGKNSSANLLEHIRATRCYFVLTNIFFKHLKKYIG